LDNLKVVVHSFVMAGVDDPDLFAAEPLINWEQSEKGRWVLEHASDIPVWTRSISEDMFGWKYTITAEFEQSALTEWMLKYGSD
jgi:hypothetical protein